MKAPEPAGASPFNRSVPLPASSDRRTNIRATTMTGAAFGLRPRYVRCGIRGQAVKVISNVKGSDSVMVAGGAKRTSIHPLPSAAACTALCRFTDTAGTALPSWTRRRLPSSTVPASRRTEMEVLFSPRTWLMTPQPCAQVRKVVKFSGRNLGAKIIRLSGASYSSPAAANSSDHEDMARA